MIDIPQSFTQRANGASGERAHVYLLRIDSMEDICFAHGQSAATKLIINMRNHLRTMLPTSALIDVMGHNIAVYSASEIDNRLVEFSESYEGDAISPALSQLINIGASIGSVLNADDIKLLLHQAQMAMHDAPFHNEGHILHYEESLVDYAKSRLKKKTDLLSALKRGELEIFLQPKVVIKSGEVFGYEALLRWPHPEIGLIHPGDFIPTSDAHRLLMRLDLYVVRTVFELLSNAPAFTLPVSINISPTTLVTAQFINLLKQLFEQTGLTPNRLEIEVTENTSLLAHEFGTALNALHNLGVRIGIDDFGVGYSSLSYLIALPIEVIKLDKFFIDDAHDRADASTLIKGMISTLNNLQKTIIVEGIETARQARLLEELGVLYGQGYYFGGASPAKEIIQNQR